MEYPFTMIANGVIKEIISKSDKHIFFRLEKSTDINTYKEMTHVLDVICFDTALIEVIKDNVGKYCATYGYLKHNYYEKDGKIVQGGNSYYLTDLKII